MPNCSLHGPHSGSRCFQCDLKESLSQQQYAAEQAEEDANRRHREAEFAAERRAQELEEHREYLVRDGNKIRARALFQRGRELYQAGLYEDACKTAQDALDEDRGYLPAHALLSAAQLESGAHSEAASSALKAIRLLNVGEWCDADAFATVMSWLGSRTYPAEVIEPLRAKIAAFTEEPDGGLLRHIASRGWGDEIVRLLPRAKLSTSDLLEVASHLNEAGCLEAADTVLRQIDIDKGLGKSPQEGSKESWVELLATLVNFEIAGGRKDFRLQLFRKIADWRAEDGLKFIHNISTGNPWDDLALLTKSSLSAFFAPQVIRWLNDKEAAAMREAASRVPQPSGLFGWRESAQRRADKERNAQSDLAKTIARREVASFLRSSAFEPYVQQGDTWSATDKVERDLHLFLGEVAYKAGFRFRAKGEWAAAVDYFAQAKDHFASGGNGDWEIDAIFELGWCLCPNRNPAGSWKEALSYFEMGIDRSASLKLVGLEGLNRYGQAWCLEPDNNPEGDWIRSIATYKVAAEMLASAQNHRWEAEALHSLGWCHQPENAPFGAWETALSWYERALPCWERAGQAEGRARSLFGKARSMAQGDMGQVTPEIARLCEQASVIFKEAGLAQRASEAEEWSRAVQKM